MKNLRKHYVATHNYIKYGFVVTGLARFLYCLSGVDLYIYIDLWCGWRCFVIVVVTTATHQPIDECFMVLYNVYIYIYIPFVSFLPCKHLRRICRWFSFVCLMLSVVLFWLEFAWYLMTDSLTTKELRLCECVFLFRVKFFIFFLTFYLSHSTSFLPTCAFI